MPLTEPGPAMGDDKDWTFAAERTCPECGYDPTSVAAADLGAALRATSSRWAVVLGRDGVGQRPSPTVWSPLEYACHVRDVHRLFAERVELMLAQDGPRFANWDQDDAAVAGRYWAQDPAAVVGQLTAAADTAAGRYDAVPADGWLRTGLRSNGAAFTVASIGRYHLHDVVHHLHDVQG